LQAVGGWDRLPGHRSRLVQDYIASLQGWISTAYLPPYAPELNPVEYLWSHWKQHELPNFCPQTFLQLSHYARKALRRMRRRTTLVTGFWAQAELF
jgi:transposase